MPDNDKLVDFDEDALRLQGLGIVARGLAHEIANPANVILMNAEIASLTSQDSADLAQDELQDALNVIVKEARRLGALAQQVYRFADASDFVGTDRVKVGSLLGQANKLLGSKPRRTGVVINFPPIASEAARLTCIGDEMALAVALALSLRQLVILGAMHIDVDAAVQNDQRITINLDGDCDGISLALNELALAKKICVDHGGTLLATGCGYRFELPRGHLG